MTIKKYTTAYIVRDEYHMLFVFLSINSVNFQASSTIVAVVVIVIISAHIFRRRHQNRVGSVTADVIAGRRTLIGMSGSDMAVEVTSTYKHLAAVATSVRRWAAAAVRRRLPVEPDVFVEVARISERTTADGALQRLEAGVRSHVNLQSVSTRVQLTTVRTHISSSSTRLITTRDSLWWRRRRRRRRSHRDITTQFRDVRSCIAGDVM